MSGSFCTAPKVNFCKYQMTSHKLNYPKHINLVLLISHILSLFFLGTFQVFLWYFPSTFMVLTGNFSLVLLCYFLSTFPFYFAYFDLMTYITCTLTSSWKKKSCIRETLNLSACADSIINTKKSRIRETPILSTDADSRTNTILVK